MVADFKLKQVDGLVLFCVEVLTGIHTLIMVSEFI